MSLMNKLARFASSPQGRRMTQKAKTYAQSPEGRRKISEMQQRLAKRKRLG